MATLLRRLEDRGLIDTARPLDGDGDAIAASGEGAGAPLSDPSPACPGA